MLYIIKLPKPSKTSLMLYYCDYGVVMRFLTVLFRKKGKSQHGFKTYRPYLGSHAQHEDDAQADVVHVQAVMLMLMYGNGCQRVGGVPTVHSLPSDLASFTCSKT